jgi:hypothetical protein
MTALAEARALAASHKLVMGPEYQRAQLQVLLAILDRLEAPAPPVAPVAEPAPDKPKTKQKG